MSTPTAAGVSVMDVSALCVLVDVLRDRGYAVIGPTVRDGAIVLDELDSAERLPFGWGVTLDAGTYRLRRRDDGAAFGHAAGPQSWKSYVHPARERLWSRDGDGPVVAADETPRRPYAFLGVRPCDLRALGILDRVLGQGRHPDQGYARRRDGVFIVAVECIEPGRTCFCGSMGSGPAAEEGYDLALTELLDGSGSVSSSPGTPTYLIRSGSPAGTDVLAELPATPADAELVAHARDAVDAAAERMGRSLPADGLRELMVENRESPHWDDVAARCVTCGNCTMVCPTCFCTTTEDVTDLTGEHAERWRRWDSCFDLDFSYIHGGSVRMSGASRYRQWITHKLSTWHDQFGSTGCVGCGRCIAWCPVGIDITEEVAMLRAGSPDERTTAGDGAEGPR
ncbi:4Fe-4S dicluster domain-containing protein [Phytoactinopolyspora halotolerans]|uniref:4Fe-4S ferredoxin n=1 Tax=Phytoactinopolyspora halotolerans TaxID=1981512 RepID=A0A6L9S6P1_9ACTN|nr:4Fe-4S dicluster domain-containing protein [Phytoactinopolyspora halotolerans]NEE00643.1 4Fe-4S ferredoxin [Phytoactinopolyspora halotolerans]